MCKHDNSDHSLATQQLVINVLQCVYIQFALHFKGLLLTHHALTYTTLYKEYVIDQPQQTGIYGP